VLEIDLNVLSRRKLKQFEGKQKSARIFFACPNLAGLQGAGLQALGTYRISRKNI